jgi:tetratricopeptide (TPR) repeat protein
MRLGDQLLPWATLLAGAALLQALPVPSARSSDGFITRTAEAASAPGAGFGGTRAVVADVLWLRANVFWERRDAAATDAYLRAAVAAEPCVDYFRINAARMIAFDFPEWARSADEPAEVSRRRRAAHCRRALALLESHPGESADALIERARLTHQVLGDRRGAARLYQQAADLPAAPAFAGRLAVELLVQEGRIDEARAWLGRWLERRSPADPAAQRDRMLARLADLEKRSAR